MRHKVKRRLRDNEDGFTLIELLVVITILGILAAVVVFSVGGVNDKGGESACDADLATLQTAQEAYFALTDKYGTMRQLAGIDPVETGGTEKKKVLSQESKLYVVAGTPSTTYNLDPVAVADLPPGFSEVCDDPDAPPAP